MDHFDRELTNAGVAVTLVSLVNVGMWGAMAMAYASSVAAGYFAPCDALNASLSGMPYVAWLLSAGVLSWTVSVPFLLLGLYSVPVPKAACRGLVFIAIVTAVFHLLGSGLWIASVRGVCPHGHGYWWLGLWHLVTQCVTWPIACLCYDVMYKLPA